MMKKDCTLWEMAGEKLSNLILIAIDDLKLTERDPRFIVDMATWHDLTHHGLCSVCFAGATMYRSGISNDDGFAALSEHRDWPAWKALNNLRMGYVRDAAIDLGLIPDLAAYVAAADLALYEQFNRDITPYHAHRDEFRLDMEQLAADLAAKGL